MTSEPTDFDLGAAWLRQASGDMRAFLAGLAVRLEGALPGRVDVERKRDGLFSRDSHVEKITVTLDNNLYSLQASHGHPTAHRSKLVRGIAIKSEQLPVPDWLAALTGDIRLLGEHAGDAQTVLHDFLMS